MQQTKELRVCRACLRTVVDGQLHKLQENGLLEKLQQVTSSRLSASDGAPKNICSFCRALLLKAHRFRLQCLESSKIRSQSAGRHNCVRNMENTSVVHNLGLTNMSIISYQPDSQVATMGHNVAVKQEQANIDHLQNVNGRFLDEPVNRNPVISNDEIHTANTSNHANHGVNELSMAIDPTTVVKTELLDVQDEVLTPEVDDVSNEETVHNTEGDLLQTVEENCNGTAHTATAGGARPYPCGQCYKLLAALKQHHRMVHGRPTTWDQSQTSEMSVDKGTHGQDTVPSNNSTSNVASAELDNIVRISPFANFSPFLLFSPFSPLSPFPPCSPEDMKEWFVRIECQFATSGISSENTKFYYVTGQLTPQYANVVSDIIMSPPASNRFSILKRELIKRLSAYHERNRQGLHGDLGHQEAPGGPQVGESRNGVPQVRESRNGVPQVGESRNGVPQVGESSNGVPQVGESRNGVPQVGESRNGVPQVGESRNGVPQVRESRNGVPQVGESRGVVPQVEERRGGVPQNAAGSSWTSMDVTESAFSVHSHSARGSNAGPYTCERCPNEFCSPSMLSKHLRSVHNCRMRVFGCGDCGRRFMSRAAVRGHILSAHRDLRPYSCARCGKTFKWMITLVAHQRTHAHDPPAQTNGSLRTDTQTQTNTQTQTDTQTQT